MRRRRTRGSLLSQPDGEKKSDGREKGGEGGEGVAKKAGETVSVCEG